MVKRWAFGISYLLFIRAFSLRKARLRDHQAAWGSITQILDFPDLIPSPYHPLQKTIWPFPSAQGF
jgi:hypothetical protein